eukprot:XP_001694018.1 predicted protein [Chlamydomonas reinhardtii]
MSQSFSQPYPSAPAALRKLSPEFGNDLLSRTDTLISRIRPTTLSLQRRFVITEHVTQLVKRCFAPHDVTAVPFGSVPLKTYLPDGDIDLSIYSYSSRAQSLKDQLRDTWATTLQLCLEDEANNPHAAFKVANVQVIHAEVKLLKCLVDNIVVDISFFQIGGLNTYNFLEDVDAFVDKAITARKHLFKDSIILVKGWCYYESRVLGAHHGLISTYALETLVLYVINLYHRELSNPLQVLYKFLVECSGFDWERYCLTLQGPIPLASFPNPVVETPEPLQREPLLTEHFMTRAYNKYTAPQVAAMGGEVKPFAIKQLNVMDPILPNNNLGRSVSKASYLRIRRAFEHGARMLAAIAEQTKELGAVVASRNFDNFFGKVWNAQRPNRKPLAATGVVDQLNGGAVMGAPGLHHPVAHLCAAHRGRLGGRREQPRQAAEVKVEPADSGKERVLPVAQGGEAGADGEGGAAMGQGPSDVSEDAAASSEGLTATPSSAAAAALRSRGALESEDPSPAPPARGGAAGVEDEDEQEADRSPSQPASESPQLPYALPVVLSEEPQPPAVALAALQRHHLQQFEAAAGSNTGGGAAAPAPVGAAVAASGKAGADGHEGHAGKGGGDGNRRPKATLIAFVLAAAT